MFIVRNLNKLSFTTFNFPQWWVVFLLVTWKTGTVPGSDRDLCAQRGFLTPIWFTLNTIISYPSSYHCSQPSSYLQFSSRQKMPWSYVFNREPLCDSHLVVWLHLLLALEGHPVFAQSPIQVQSDGPPVLSWSISPLAMFIYIYICDMYDFYLPEQVVTNIKCTRKSTTLKIQPCTRHQLEWLGSPCSHVAANAELGWVCLIVDEGN